MNISIIHTEHNVYQYMVNHENSWISQESLMALKKRLVSSYLVSQQNVREIIKIEEVDPISDVDGQCLNGTIEDSKDVYSFEREEYMSYKSEIYNIKIPSKNHFMPHERPYQTEKPYKCDECGKQFSQHSCLKQHKIVHTGQKHFKCDECGKQFLRSGELKRHQLVHTGEKAFKCDECGKQFSRRDSLKLHKVIHTGEGTFKCNECGKQFSQMSHLKSHKVVHTGEKGF